MTTFDNFWQLLTTFDSFWQLLTNFDSFWQPMTAYYSFWQVMTTFDSLRQLKTDSHWGLIKISWNNLYDCPKRKSCEKKWFSYSLRQLMTWMIGSFLGFRNLPDRILFWCKQLYTRVEPSMALHEFRFCDSCFSYPFPPKPRFS